MSEIFSPEWMESFGNQWNAEAGLADALAEIDFDSNIAYGFAGDPAPKGVLVVEKGHVVRSGAYNGEPLNWDIRSTPEQWDKWLTKPPSMMTLGVSYTTGKLKFETGDYAAMIKDPRMAGPFIKSFAAMSRVAA
ncbi:SCP-2 sterol transfer family protein [Sagittula sp. S175]|uniref:SCP-2 sterol transfer family protein n=1 Tax=Sagittula sp. S175 TaxID=3415129 RepID=UPI003C7CCD7E